MRARPPPRLRPPREGETPKSPRSRFQGSRATARTSGREGWGTGGMDEHCYHANHIEPVIVRAVHRPGDFRDPNARTREARCSQALTGRTRCSVLGRCASKRSGSQPDHWPGWAGLTAACPARRRCCAPLPRKTSAARQDAMNLVRAVSGSGGSSSAHLGSVHAAVTPTLMSHCRPVHFLHLAPQKRWGEPPRRTRNGRSHHLHNFEEPSAITKAVNARQFGVFLSSRSTVRDLDPIGPKRDDAGGRKQFYPDRAGIEPRARARMAWQLPPEKARLP